MWNSRWTAWKLHCPIRVNIQFEPAIDEMDSGITIFVWEVQLNKAVKDEEILHFMDLKTNCKWH